MSDNQGRPNNFGEILLGSLAKGLGQYQADKVAQGESNRQNYLTAIKLSADQQQQQLAVQEHVATMSHLAKQTALADEQIRELQLKNSMTPQQRMDYENKKAMELEQSKLDAEFANKVKLLKYGAGQGLIPEGWKQDNPVGSVNATQIKQIKGKIAGIVGGANTKNLGIKNKYIQDVNKFPVDSTNAAKTEKAVASPVLGDTVNTSAAVNDYIEGLGLPDNVTNDLKLQAQNGYHLEDPNSGGLPNTPVTPTEEALGRTAVENWDQLPNWKKRLGIQLWWKSLEGLKTK